MLWDWILGLQMCGSIVCYNCNRRCNFYYYFGDEVQDNCMDMAISDTSEQLDQSVSVSYRIERLPAFVIVTLLLFFTFVTTPPKLGVDYFNTNWYHGTILKILTLFTSQILMLLLMPLFHTCLCTCYFKLLFSEPYTTNKLQYIM